jgi:hypothetical protein
MMKRIFYYLLLLTFSNTHAFAQTDSTGAIDSVQQRIFLIGDAGELKNNAHPVVDWLKKNVDWNDERNLVLYLGDNIYPLGMPTEGEPSYPQSKKIIDYQISLVKNKKAKGLFCTGQPRLEEWKTGWLAADP